MYPVSVAFFPAFAITASCCPLTSIEAQCFTERPGTVDKLRHMFLTRPVFRLFQSLNRDMATRKVILVTGANRGLGFAIIQVGGTRDPSSHYILACRDIEAGVKATTELKQSGVVASLEVLQLDTTKDTEIAKAVKHVATTHGKLDSKSPRKNTTVHMYAQNG
jgi:hypothetical protein